VLRQSRAVGGGWSLIGFGLFMGLGVLVNAGGRHGFVALELGLLVRRHRAELEQRLSWRPE